MILLHGAIIACGTWMRWYDLRQFIMLRSQSPSIIGFLNDQRLPVFALSSFLSSADFCTLFKVFGIKKNNVTLHPKNTHQQNSYLPQPATLLYKKEKLTKTYRFIMVVRILGIRFLIAFCWIIMNEGLCDPYWRVIKIPPHPDSRFFILIRIRSPSKWKIPLTHSTCNA